MNYRIHLNDTAETLIDCTSYTEFAESIKYSKNSPDVGFIPMRYIKWIELLDESTPLQSNTNEEATKED